MPDPQILRVGIPKGSLAESTIDLFKRAGFEIVLSARTYYPAIDDPELACVMFRAQEMSRYVEDGAIDMGLTGYDWIRENDSDVVDVAELVYSKATSHPARWVLAVPADSRVQRAEDLDGGIVATELVNVVRRFFRERGLDVRVEYSWGATEVKAPLLHQATNGKGGIVELTETGSSLVANNLRIVEEILTTTTRLIANKAAWNDQWKRQKIKSISMLLQGAIEARAKAGLKMNVARADLDGVLALLPAEKSPTMSPLADDNYVAVEVVLEVRIARDLMPRLKRAGATGLIIYPLNQVIP